MLNNREADVLQRILREAGTRTISGAFDRFLEKEINIAPGIREMASASQNHLRELLAGETDRDSTFPRVLSAEDSDFLGGSFARHVKNWPLDDIDIYFPLDGHTLVYLEMGARLPYTVISDGVLPTNPLLTARWMDGTYISSTKLVEGFAAVLRRHYPEETEVFPNGEAVSIRMKQGETDSGKGLGYDVVPCFLLRPDNPLELPFYVMPNGSGGWLRTNPRHDKDISDNLQEKNGKTFRKAVKLVKYWNTSQLDGVLPSYYIELAIARAFLEENRNGSFINSVPLAVATGFWALNKAVGLGGQTPWISGAPTVEPGAINAVHKILVANAHTISLEAWNQERAGQDEVAIMTWQKLFGSSFE